jgi:hypothetical protein
MPVAGHWNFLSKGSMSHVSIYKEDTVMYKIQIFIGNACKMVFHKFDYKQMAPAFPAKYFVIDFPTLEYYENKCEDLSCSNCVVTTEYLKLGVVELLIMLTPNVYLAVKQCA